MTMPAVVSVQPYADVVKAALDGQGVAHKEGAKPATTAGSPYIVWWLDGGSITDRSMLSRDGFSVVLTLQCYGQSPEAVRVALRKGRAAVRTLPGATVDGRVLLVPSHTPAPVMDRDDDVQPPLFYQSDEWRIRTS